MRNPAIMVAKLSYIENKSIISVFVSRFPLSITQIDHEKSDNIGPELQGFILKALVPIIVLET